VAVFASSEHGGEHPMEPSVFWLGWSVFWRQAQHGVHQRHKRTVFQWWISLRSLQAVWFLDIAVKFL